MSSSSLVKCLVACAVVASFGASLSAQSARQTARPPGEAPGAQLGPLVAEATAVRIPTRSASEFAAAAKAYESVLARLRGIDRSALGLDDQVDYDLLEAWLRTQLFEIVETKQHQLVPVSYFALGQTSGLFMRPGAIADAGVRGAIRELRALPTILENGKKNLTTPARTWTENALYQAYYAQLLLEHYVPTAVVDDPAVKTELLAASREALAAVQDFEQWLEHELLPRSTRPPTWKPEEIDFYQLVFEQLDKYPVDEMLRIAEAEEKQLLVEMAELARQIHPSGDLRRVWEVMKDEAPPWEGVLPMAQRYVDMASDWLRGPGNHVVTIPEYIDYGAMITTPMGRRTLSFGGASMGPTVAGRQSGYYVLTPLEDRLTPEEKASRIRSYNPYWTHVISYHEWLGHNVQIAARNEHVTRPMRRAFRSGYFSQAWSFYLEKLLEDEGYYEVLPYMERLKTSMARRQMRMWRVQRIVTKLKMAKGEMTFEEAVQAYIDKIGMEPTNAFIEVQRDCQNPTPPGREIIGELAILELRQEYERRMGRHYSLKRFNDTLLTYGDLPFKQIRRLMFRD